MMKNKHGRGRGGRGEGSSKPIRPRDEKDEMRKRDEEFLDANRRLVVQNCMDANIALANVSMELTLMTMNNNNGM
jgi:hypothetical protein